MILVTGATGQVGRAVVAGLIEAGEPVRALTRDPAKAALPAAAEVVQGDLGLPDTLGPALAGVDKVYLLLGLDHGEAFIKAASAAGVRQVVLLSASAVDDSAGEVTNPLARHHWLGEQALRQSGLAWTILRPGAFMSNTLDWAGSIRGNGVVHAPFATVRTAGIHPADIGAVAVKALLSPGHQSKIHTLTGPEALSAVDQVRIIGAALGRDLRCNDLDEDAARQHMLSQHIPAPVVEGMLGLLRDADDSVAQVLPTVPDLTGRPARTFAQWTAENLDAFR